MEDFTNTTTPQQPEPIQSSGRQTGQNLGIAALITAIITFVLAVIPCVGLIALIPGIIAIVLASVGLSHASRNDSPRGVLIAGLIIAIVATMISFSQVFVAGKLAQQADKWPNKLEDIMKDVETRVKSDLEDANVSIKIESNGEVVEINAKTDKTDKVQTLEDLEKGNAPAGDTLEKSK
jgi:uncharacterized membrane protein YgaE (UPF0421/DUF939 family)